jgi:hypothetical protein
MSLEHEARILDDTTNLFLDRLFPELEKLNLEFLMAKWNSTSQVFTIKLYDEITQQENLTLIPIAAIEQWLTYPTGPTALDLIIANSDILPDIQTEEDLEDLLYEQLEHEFTHPFDLAIDPLSIFIVNYEHTH